MAVEMIVNALVPEHVLLLAQDAKHLPLDVNEMVPKRIALLEATEMIIAGTEMTRTQNMMIPDIGAMTANAKNACQQNVNVETKKEHPNEILPGSQRAIAVGLEKSVILGPSDQLETGKLPRVMTPRTARNGEIEREKEKRRKSQHGWTPIFQTVLASASWEGEVLTENLMAYKHGRRG